jgi:signal transduction histidine kinase
MDQLIGDLLDYGRLSHLRLESAYLPLECHLNAALAQLSSDLTATAAEVRMDRPLPSVWANASVLTQILVNLLSNALKFVKPGDTPRLYIWAERREMAVRLWIQDNGIGIAPEHQERVFHVFERLHASQDYPGTGIGLAIVMKGVQRMGGRAGVESKLGEGSRFWVELPVSQ